MAEASVNSIRCAKVHRDSDRWRKVFFHRRPSQRGRNRPLRLPAWLLLTQDGQFRPVETYRFFRRMRRKPLRHRTNAFEDFLCDWREMQLAEAGPLLVTWMP